MECENQRKREKKPKIKFWWKRLTKWSLKEREKKKNEFQISQKPWADLNAERERETA